MGRNPVRGMLHNAHCFLCIDGMKREWRNWQTRQT